MKETLPKMESAGLRTRALALEKKYFFELFSKEAIQKKFNPKKYGMKRWKFETKHFPGGSAGRCDPEKRVIEIDPQHRKDDTALLHEMIHAYEETISRTSEYVYLQYLSLRLYSKLARKIRRLPSIIDRHYFYFQDHSPFFFLKSLDLDLRLQKPLGTVLGYGTTKEITIIQKRKKEISPSLFTGSAFRRKKCSHFSVPV